jgi:hypothetical protein
MSANNKGHSNLTPLCLAEYPLVSDIANLQYSLDIYNENDTKGVWLQLYQRVGTNCPPPFHSTNVL